MSSQSLNLRPVSLSLSSQICRRPLPAEMESLVPLRDALQFASFASKSSRNGNDLNQNFFLETTLTIRTKPVTMTKRRAADTLEEIFATDSPPSKKTRLEDFHDPEYVPVHGNGDPFATTNGHEREVDERNGNDILAAADQEGEGLEEAAGRSRSDSPDIDEEASALTAPARQDAPLDGYSDLYLDSINRSLLDFDFEKLCSVSLSNINVYACLVCGKYFQGRGTKSHAYFHALEVGHHVYVNMQTKKVYVLPEGYEVKNKSLDDIKFVVDPRYTKEEVMKLDKQVKDAWDLAGKRYRPGFIGMNNIKSNDYLNVIVQSLAHIAPVRNFFLLTPTLTTNVQPSTPQLPLRFSTLLRKIWNPRAFKSHVSPHELLQEIALRSSKRFTLTQQSDPVEFLTWFLNNLHLSLGGSRKPAPLPPQNPTLLKPSTSIIHKTFLGHVRIESQAITARSDTAGARLTFEESATTTSTTQPFLILTLDLPPAPLFQSDRDKNIIPQVPLTTLLNKYSGLHASEKLAHRVRHRLLHPLPPVLLFHIKRFTKNKFVSERNPTIVTFPSPRALDMSPFVEPNPEYHPGGEPIWYDMVANIILDANTSATGEEGGDNVGTGGTEGGKVAWKVQVRDKAQAEALQVGGKREGEYQGPEWLEIQDLWVERAEAETLFTRESYLMVWEARKKDAKGKGKGKGKDKMGLS
jgi:U4/U6.U5 tri-snRNP-associated protein 2